MRGRTRCATSGGNSAAAARYRRTWRAASHRIGVAMPFESTGQLRIATNEQAHYFRYGHVCVKLRTDVCFHCCVHIERFSISPST